MIHAAYYNLLLFIITFIGGSIPIWLKKLNDERMHLFLSFSGAFLLSITFLHLLPETIDALSIKAGFFMLAGFFLQLVIQRVTHGVEHGHAHIQAHHPVALWPIVVGLTIHSFMEGLPLGVQYKMAATTPSLYLAVGVHKIPEAILITSLAIRKGRKVSLCLLLFFSIVTPFAAIVSNILGSKYHTASEAVIYLIPVVAGAFIHIATTIFFESGTKQHQLSRQKIIAFIVGIGIAICTMER